MPNKSNNTNDEIEAIGQGDTPISTSEQANVAMIGQTSSGGVIGSKGMDNGLLLSSARWSDFLSDTTIGELLSEASLMGHFNITDSKSKGSRSAFQPTELIPDSLDAFVANQLKCFQEQTTVSPGPTS
ncbi:hypothetical protein Ancab_026754 [Ancistrocladus abbreviatus]